MASDVVIVRLQNQISNFLQPVTHKSFKIQKRFILLKNRPTYMLFIMFFKCDTIAEIVL